MAIKIIQLNSAQDFITRFFFSTTHKDIETLYSILGTVLLILLGVILFSIKQQDKNTSKKSVAHLMPVSSGGSKRWTDYVASEDRQDLGLVGLSVQSLSNLRSLYYNWALPFNPPGSDWVWDGPFEDYTSLQRIILR